MQKNNDNAISMSGWPIVETRFYHAAKDDEVTHWLCDLTSLLNKFSPFVMVIITPKNAAFSMEGQKAQAKWFKQHKLLIEQYCQGLARVVESAKQADQLDTQALQNAMPMPFLVTTEIDQARCWAKNQFASEVS